MSERSHRDAAARVRPEIALGEGMRFDGLLVLTRSARIEGHASGSVCADDSVEVGAHGVVEADLEAPEVVVDGRVKGDVVASASITLGPDAQVEGDLTAPTLRIAEGARIEGRIRCGEAPATSIDGPSVSPAENRAETPDPSTSAS